jgi:predicted PurR-regulated permease PerM
MPYQNLKKTALILLILVLILVILYFGKSFLVPVTFAALLATLLHPASRWLQRKGVNRALSILLSMILLVGFFAGLIALLSWQVADLAKDAPQIEKQVTERYQQVQEYVNKTLNISPKKQQEIIDEQKSSGSGKAGGMLTGIVSSLGGFVTDIILTLVYIFLFMYYKDHLKKFVVRLAPDDKKEVALQIIHDSAKVSQQYLTGLAMMIGALWVMYGIGFSIVGVKSPVFFAILCGMLEIIPFIGNIIGTTLTLAVSVMQGGGTNLIIGILVTYGVVQFVQTYLLEPLVVGAEVNINPLFTILCLVAGEMVWGLPGMILAIPVTGIAKIVFDHIEPLKPFGELIGGTQNEGEGKVKKKLKNAGRKVKEVFTGK